MFNRTDFANRLHSIVAPEGLPRETLNSIVLPLSEVIVQMMPFSLYRYRPCNENDKEALERQIAAFKEDKIYAVTADKFNDPFDTLVRYDINSVKESVSSLFSIDILGKTKDFFVQGNDLSDMEQQMFPKDSYQSIKEQILAADFNNMGNQIESTKQRVLSSIDLFYPLLANMIKRFVKIACFSESVQSITMWSHYAFSHQGFALEYNFRPTLDNGIENCVLFPVIYGDERFDASSYMAWCFLKLFGLNVPMPDALSHIKCSLHKAPEWEYEKEWRLLYYTQGNIFTNQISTIVFKPSAIYYGALLSQSTKEQLHYIALEKGIKEFEMYVEDSSPRYQMLFKPYGS